jgi:non-specific serine/threonine protein kinase
MPALARDRLVETDEVWTVRARHRDHFLALAEEAWPKLRSAEQAQWLTVWEEAHDNLRLALSFCLKEPEGGEAGLRLGAALQLFWWTRGHLSEGRQHLSAVLSYPMGQGDLKARADALNGAGGRAWMQGDYAAARALLEESLTIFRELGDKRGTANSLESHAALAHQEQQAGRAARLWGAATSLREAIGSPRPPGDPETYDHEVAEVRSVLGEAAFDAAFEEGRAMSWEQAVAVALGETQE